MATFVDMLISLTVASFWLTFLLILGVAPNVAAAGGALALGCVYFTLALFRNGGR